MVRTHKRNFRSGGGVITVERIVGRLKDFRRIAPRYGKLATNSLAAIHLAAAVSYWL